VITRVWRGWTRTTADADAYERLLRDEILPGIRRVPGFAGASVLRRDVEDGVEFLVLTRFASLDDVRAVAGADFDVPVIEPEARLLLSRVEERALHYETVVELP
jgi:heme-degrading monooxygenase HmoA